MSNNPTLEPLQRIGDSSSAMELDGDVKYKECNDHKLSKVSSTDTTKPILINRPQGPQGLDKYKIVVFINSSFTCKIKDKETKLTYSMKIRKELMPLSIYDNESKILLELLECPYLIPFQESFLNDFGSDWGIKYCIVYPYYKTTLIMKIYHAKSEQGETDIINWISQICEAVRMLHQRNIIHRKLQSSNIFLDHENIIKVGDIGISGSSMDRNIEKRSNIISIGTIIL